MADMPNCRCGADIAFYVLEPLEQDSTDKEGRKAYCCRDCLADAVDEMSDSTGYPTIVSLL